MSEPIPGTRDQTPDDVRRLTPAAFAVGDAVPGLSSWLLERKLGDGGFGEVWLAKHAWDAEQPPRAVKFCLDPAARHRLVTHERNVVVRVMKYAGKHPNIVPLLDCNLDGDIPWLMYQFIEGGTLTSLIEEWRDLPLRKRLGRAVRVLHALAGALATCHRFDPPLVHRDMKPQNVLMAGAVPRIADFGIGSVVMRPEDGPAAGARTAHAARLPSALHAAGTRLYAPPEQLYGSPPHPRDDVYALGVIAYQMVTADLTTGPGPDATLELRDLKVPGELVALIVPSVAINPDRRPKDAGEWEVALAALIAKAQKSRDGADGGTGVAGPAPRPDPAAAPTERPPARTDPAPPPQPVTGPVPPPPVRPAPRSAANRPRTRRSLLLAVVGVAVLGLVAAIVISQLPPDGRPDPTTPTAKEEPKAPVPDDPRGETDPKKPKDPEPAPKTGTPVRPPTEARDVEIAPGVKMTFCWVPPGEYQLGSPKAERDAVLTALKGTSEPDLLQAEAEERRVKYATKGFWMGKNEVTQTEWAAVMGSNPSRFDGKKENRARGMDVAQFPVESVSCDMICGKGGFLEKVNASGGIQQVFGKGGRFALPHEDEWEYACRGGRGNQQPFYFGTEVNGTQANIDGSHPPGEAPGPNVQRPAPVATYAAGFPHPWGLSDMHGNVGEWCENVYAPDSGMVIRGGSWFQDAESCRAASRQQALPGFASDFVGFRLIIRLD